MCTLTASDASACKRRVSHHRVRHTAVHFHRSTPVRTVVRTVYVDRPAQVIYRDRYAPDYTSDDAPVSDHFRRYAADSDDSIRCRDSYDDYDQYSPEDYREPRRYQSAFRVRSDREDYRHARYRRGDDCP